MTLETLKPGCYVLVADVTNPRPDRRRRDDWEAEETWSKGRKFVVAARRFAFSDVAGEHVDTQLVIVASGQPFPSQHTIPCTLPTGRDDRAGSMFAALLPHLVPVVGYDPQADDTQRDVEGETPMRSISLRHLVEAGLMPPEVARGFIAAVTDVWHREHEAEMARRDTAGRRSMAPLEAVERREALENPRCTAPEAEWPQHEGPHTCGSESYCPYPSQRR